MLIPEQSLELARKTWPQARLRRARKWHRCDNILCGQLIAVGRHYIDPGGANPDSARGFGGYRYCLRCAGGRPVD
jgi:hypothetical protein